MPKSDERRRAHELELVQPVYLNVPMMVSFLAALEGGIAYTEQVKEVGQASRAADREGSGKLGLPGVTSLFGLSVDMSGRLKQSSSNEESVETSVVREHTEASLFNLLRHRLNETGRIDYVATSDDIAAAYPGQIVEVEGEIIGNPLRQILDAFAALIPFAGIDQQQSTGAAKKGPRVQSPANSGPPEMAMFKTMLDDVNKATVIDLVLEADNDVRAVLTMAREFLPRAAEDNLLQGHFVALGKVTRTFSREGEQVNLLRRTAFGFGGGQLARQMFQDVKFGESDFRLSEPVVSAPLLQVMPLAVFV